MKKFLCFVTSIVFLCVGCNNEKSSGDTEMTASSILNFSQEDNIIDLNIYVDNGGGFIDISDDDFINKAKKIHKTTTYEELVEVFGKEPGDIKECAYDDYFYMNDNYLLRYHYGFGVVLFEFSNPQDYVVIDE